MASQSTSHADVIVIGVGAMGSATAHQLAKRGLSVIGLEQFEPGHARGSSHGDTRIIRQAYFEHPDYVPLALRAYELWAALEEESGDSGLLTETGMLTVGPPGDTGIVARTAQSAERYGLAVETLDRAEIARRYPMFFVPPDATGIYEPQAGFLAVERAVRTMAERAARHGARIVTGVTVNSWRAHAGGVEVETSQGRFAAARLVVTAGAWSGLLLERLGLPLTVHRNLLFWFAGTPDFGVGRAPIFGFDQPGGFYYGIPAINDTGVKVARHVPGDVIRRPEDAVRTISSRDVAPVTGFLSRHLRGVVPLLTRYSVCFYSMTPDEHFIIDRHPEHEQVVFAAGFSGHGFKFAPVVGEALADLSEKGRTALPIGFLGLSRFAGA